MVFRSRQRRPHPADVAMQTTGKSRQVHWHFTGIAKRGRHVPALSVRVPIHRRLEKKPVHDKQITSPAPPRANVIEQFSLPAHSRIAGTLKVEPDFSLIGVNAIVHPRFLMDEISGEKVRDRRSTGLRHRSFRVGIVNRGVAASAGLISHISGGARIRRAPRSLSPRSGSSAQQRPQQKSKKMAHSITSANRRFRLVVGHRALQLLQILPCQSMCRIDLERAFELCFSFDEVP